MFIIGLICKRLHDDYKEYPNLFIGYKLKYAMKDRETWEEANNYIFKPCTIVFILSIIITLFINFLNLMINNMVYLSIMILIFVAPIFSTEIHIRRFNKKRGN